MLFTTYLMFLIFFKVYSKSDINFVFETNCKVRRNFCVTVKIYEVDVFSSHEYSLAKSCATNGTVINQENVDFIDDPGLDYEFIFIGQHTCTEDGRIAYWKQKKDLRISIGSYYLFKRVTTDPDFPQQ